MVTAGKWVPAGVIRSDRSLGKGEQLVVVLIDSNSGAEIERIEVIPPKGIENRYSWPLLLANHINYKATHIRAGIQKSDGSFTTEGSSYKNQLWVTGNGARAFITTASNINEWKDLYQIKAIGSLPRGISVTCRLAHAVKNVTYQTFTYSFKDNELGNWVWPSCLSRAMNESNGLLRAGEKDESRNSFTPIGSGYRNKIWAPSASVPLSLSFTINASAATLKSAGDIYAALCGTVSAPPSTKKEVDAWLSGFSAGKFADISYPSKFDAANAQKVVRISDVSALETHLNRIVGISRYLSTMTSVDNSYLDMAVKALQFYAQENYDTANWWQRQIGLAKKVCTAILLLAKHLIKKELMNDVIPYLMKTTNTHAFRHTGANLADFVTVQTIWSISAWKISGDAAYLLYLKAAVDNLSALCLPVERDGVEEGEGINIDYSISQHNPRQGKQICSHLYSGTYGHEMLGRIFELLPVLRNEFSIGSDAINGLGKLLIHGLGWTGYAGFLDFQTCGRGVSRSSSFNNRAHGRWANSLMSYAGTEEIGPMTELARRASTGDETKNSHFKGGKLFWVNDYLVHFGAGYGLWAKAVSKRTVGTESGNGENLKALYMGAGTYFLTRHGKEFLNIQPVWVWQRLPGTTVEQVPGFQWPALNWGQGAWGNHDFAGGVSTGGKSILSMEWSRNNISHAYKTVMAVEDRIICIGTGIDIRKAIHPVITSVNQCLLQGSVRYMDLLGREHSVAPGQTVTASDIHMVHHDGFLYTFGDLGGRPNVTIHVASQKGRWSDINTAGSADLVEASLFSMWINHPAQQTGSYLYEIQPTDGFPKNRPVLSTSGISSTVHFWGDGEKLAMVSCFKVPPVTDSSSKIPGRVSPEYPCSYICESDTGEIRLACADPTQIRQTLSFVENTLAKSSAAGRKIEIVLPQGDLRGSTVKGSYALTK